MDIIFESLPSYLDPVGRWLKRIGYNVFYLKLSGDGQSTEAERQRAISLRASGILPLPLEFLPHLAGIREDYADPENKLQKHIHRFAPNALLRAYEGLYPDNANIAAKLHAEIQSLLAGRIDNGNLINLWAKAHPERKHLVIYPNLIGFLAPDFVSNVRCLIVPADSVFKVRGAATRIVCKVFQAITAKLLRKSSPATATSLEPENILNSRVVLVTHKGLDYGDLFKKTLFYSDNINSELHQENLLHFDYSGFPSPSKKIKWVCLRGRSQSLWFNLQHVLVAIGRGLLNVRHARHIIGLLLLVRTYICFKSYAKQLVAYPNLRVALIDYEVLCPKSLLLAFEARNIKTVAAQERFILSFYATFGSVLNTYLCASDYSAEVMRKSSFYCVDNYLPVGMHRSDSLVQARKLPPPQVLQEPLALGRKIITALGFHTHLDWYTSQPDTFVNWSAHRRFLEEMIQLSKDISNVFIILRYKFVDWVSLPIFADIVQEIESSENMAISMDYEKSLFSYDLCAHSHLVIAKHTSLGDECLAVGIPVLFHEYTHNSERLVADAFDYGSTRVMCFNYRDLLERSQAILSGAPHELDSDYEYLKNVIYGGLGDGKVQERIHTHIESLIN